jgi:hypothetical protein
LNEIRLNCRVKMDSKFQCMRALYVIMLLWQVLHSRTRKKNHSLHMSKEHWQNDNWLQKSVLSESPPLLPLCPPGWSMLVCAGHSETLVTTSNWLSNGMAN